MFQVHFDKTFTGGTLQGVTVPTVISYPTRRRAEQVRQFYSKVEREGDFCRDTTGNPFTVARVSVVVAVPRLR